MTASFLWYPVCAFTYFPFILALLPADIFKGLVSFSSKGSTMYTFSIMSGVLSPNTGVSFIPYANSTPANIINIAKIF